MYYYLRAITLDVQRAIYFKYLRLPDSPGFVATAMTSTPRSFKFSVPLLLTRYACSITQSNALGNASAWNPIANEGITPPNLVDFCVWILSPSNFPEALNTMTHKYDFELNQLWLKKFGTLLEHIDVYYSKYTYSRIANPVSSQLVSIPRIKFRLKMVW